MIRIPFTKILILLLMAVVITIIYLTYFNKTKNVEQYTFTFHGSLLSGRGFHGEDEIFVDNISIENVNSNDNPNYKSYFILSASNNGKAGEIIHNSDAYPMEKLFVTARVESIIDDEKLILSGETVSGGKTVAIYNIKSKEILWLTPPDKIYKYLGHSKKRNSILLSIIPSTFSDYGPIGWSGNAILAEGIYSGKSVKTLIRIDDQENPFKSTPFTYAAISQNGRNVVVTGSAISGIRSVHLVTEIDNNNYKSIYISTNYHGRAYWLKNGNQFIMTCDISKICLYSLEGKVVRIYENNHGRFFLSDYDANTDKMLLERFNTNDNNDIQFSISEFHKNSTEVPIGMRVMEILDRWLYG